MRTLNSQTSEERHFEADKDNRINQGYIVVSWDIVNGLLEMEPPKQLSPRHTDFLVIPDSIIRRLLKNIYE